MACNARFRQTGSFIPLASGMGIEQGFRCAEGFAGDAEDGGFGIELFQLLRDVGVVGIADEMHAYVFAVVIQRLCAHLRTQIRAANADVDEIGDAFAGDAGVVAADDALSKGQGAVKFVMELGDDVFTVNHNRRGVFRRP